MRAGLVALLVALALPGPASADVAEASVAGLYDGRQMELGAQLELGADGRYRYQLSYGALDEWSAGTWTMEGDAVVLSSDPFTPPAFDVENVEPGVGGLTIRLELPDGMEPQYFGVTLVRADQSVTNAEMSGDALVVPMGDNPVVSVRPVLPVMELLGPVFAVPAGGASLRIAFSPNDLGVAGFDHERLVRNGDAYELVRHGRTIRFRKVNPQVAP